MNLVSICLLLVGLVQGCTILDARNVKDQEDSEAIVNLMRDLDITKEKLELVFTNIDYPRFAIDLYRKLQLKYPNIDDMTNDQVLSLGQAYSESVSREMQAWCRFYKQRVVNILGQPFLDYTSDRSELMRVGNQLPAIRQIQGVMNACEVFGVTSEHDSGASTSSSSAQDQSKFKVE